MATTQEVEQQLKDKASQLLAGDKSAAPVATPPKTPAPAVKAAGTVKPVKKPEPKPARAPSPAAQKAIGISSVPEGITRDMQGIIQERDKQLAATPLPDKPIAKFTQPQKENFTAMSSMLMVLGALAGQKSMYPATAALNNMAGVMKGIHEGNVEAYQKNKAEFDANYKLAEENYNRVMDRRKEIMDISKGDLAVKDKLMHDFYLEQGIDAKFQHNEIEYTNGLNNLQAKLAEQKIQFDRILASVVNPSMKPTASKSNDAAVARYNLERDRELARTNRPEKIKEINKRFDDQIAALSTAPEAPAAAPAAGKPTPTQADIDYVRAHPEARAQFESHFGVAP